jgi:hypothetical protein
MQGETEKERKDGERILNNYKKQLAERMAREAAENGDAMSRRSRPFSGSSKKSKMGSTSMTGASSKTKNKESEEQKLI